MLGDNQKDVALYLTWSPIWAPFMNTIEPQAHTAASLLMYDGMTWVKHEQGDCANDTDRLEL